MKSKIMYAIWMMTLAVFLVSFGASSSSAYSLTNNALAKNRTSFEGGNYPSFIQFVTARLQMQGYKAEVIYNNPYVQVKELDENVLAKYDLNQNILVKISSNINMIMSVSARSSILNSSNAKLLIGLMSEQNKKIAVVREFKLSDIYSDTTIDQPNQESGGSFITAIAVLVGILMEKIAEEVIDDIFDFLNDEVEEAVKDAAEDVVEAVVDVVEDTVDAIGDWTGLW
jgi:hypothetical protein